MAMGMETANRQQVADWLGPGATDGFDRCRCPSWLV